MKVSHKVSIVASLVVAITFSIFSWIQYLTVRDALFEKTENTTKEAALVLSTQITNWLNGKLGLIDLMAQAIDKDFNGETIQDTFDLPLLKEEFILIFGGLDTDGARITNDPSWNPASWDARKRPWYPYARQNSQAVLTAPYPDAASGEILVSAVANFTRHIGTSLCQRAASSSDGRGHRSKASNGSKSKTNAAPPSMR